MVLFFLFAVIVDFWLILLSIKLFKIMAIVTVITKNTHTLRIIWPYSLLKCWRWNRFSSIPMKRFNVCTYWTYRRVIQSGFAESATSFVYTFIATAAIQTFKVSVTLTFNKYLSSFIAFGFSFLYLALVLNSHRYVFCVHCILTALFCSVNRAKALVRRKGHSKQKLHCWCA